MHLASKVRLYAVVKHGSKTTLSSPWIQESKTKVTALGSDLTADFTHSKKSPVPFSTSQILLPTPTPQWLCRSVRLESSSSSSSSSAGDTGTGGAREDKPPFPPAAAAAAEGSTTARMREFETARSFDDIPGPTSMHHAIPFAGTRLLYYPFSNFKTENMGSMLSMLQANYGPIMRVRIGAEWMVFIENLSDIERLVKSAEEEEKSMPKFPTPHKTLLDNIPPPRVQDPAMDWLHGGMRTKRLRNVVSQVLNSTEMVDRHLKRQDKLAEQMVDNIPKVFKSPHDIQTLTYRYALESIMQICLNKQMGLLGEKYYVDEEKQRLVRSLRTVVQCLGEAQTGTRVINLLFPDSFSKKFSLARDHVRMWERTSLQEASMEVVQHQLVGSNFIESDDPSLLTLLLKDNTFSQTEVFDTIHALVVTGTDSVACALQMLLYSLATNVDKQEKLSHEVLRALGPEGALTTHKLDSMDYLKACVKESIRLNFPMSAGGRVRLTSNIVLGNYLVPAGTQVVVNSRRTAKNPLWFDYPHFFLPERWLGGQSHAIPPLAFLPFGFGSNLFSSRTFALQELHAACCKIIQRYKVDLPSSYHNGQLQTIYTPFKTPKEPLHLEFTRHPDSASISLSH